jgi:hypothetical protein
MCCFKHHLPRSKIMNQKWPNSFSERFHIFALGETFDVDAFLARSSLRPDFVWRQMGNGPTNGLEILLGDVDRTTLQQQEEIAVNYLSAHRDELRCLASFPGVEALNLGLVYRVGPNQLGVCLGPSRALMISALDSGVRPNYYVTITGRGSQLSEAQDKSE